MKPLWLHKHCYMECTTHWSLQSPRSPVEGQEWRIQHTHYLLGTCRPCLVARRADSTHTLPPGNKPAMSGGKTGRFNTHITSWEHAGHAWWESPDLDVGPGARTKTSHGERTRAKTSHWKSGPHTGWSRLGVGTGAGTWKEEQMSYGNMVIMSLL